MKTKHTIISVLMILAIVTTLCVVMAAPAAADVSQPTAPTIDMTVTPTENQIGVASDYTGMSFQTSVALPAGSIIVMTFPANTGFVAANLGVTESAVSGATYTPTVSIGSGSALANVITIAITVATVPAGTIITVASNGANSVTNPPVPGSKTYTVKTSATGDTTAVTSLPYTIAGIMVTGGSVPTLPRTAPMGQTMTVIGAGYTPGQSFDILYSLPAPGVTLVANAGTVAADGTLTGTFPQPSTTGGNITVRDGTGLVRNTQTLTVSPSITISPTTGLVGATAVVTGRNFTAFVAAETVAVTIGGVAAGTITPTVGATTFTGNVTIPSTTGGAKTVRATASTSADTATAAFTGIGQTIALSPASATAGATITASGTGFKALEYVTITYGAVTKTTMAGADGAYSTTFGVPTGGVTGLVTATGVTSAATATATLTITNATLAISPAMGAIGTSVTVTGTGLTPLTNVSVLFNDTGTGMVTILKAVTTNSVGGFTTSVVIPGASTGASTITITPALGTIAQPFVITAGSVPVVVSDGFSTIAGQYSIVWTFDAATQGWKLYDTAAGATSTLTTLNRGQGYWIQVSQNCTLAYGGNTYALVAGWNLIGWLG